MTSAVHQVTPTTAAAAEPRLTGAHVAWLPHRGLGNGLDTDVWAPVLEITGPVAVALLDVLATAGVPAFASPLRPEPSDVWRLWVGTSRYHTAEQTLLQAMPRILTDEPDGLR
jgi:hypothetical protein